MDSESQRVIVRLFDKESEKTLGRLIIDAASPNKKSNSFQKLAKGTENIKCENIPKTTDPDASTPIQFYDKDLQNIGPLSWIMLLEETDYQVTFEVDANIRPIKSKQILPTIRKNDKNNVTFDEWRSQDNDSCYRGILNFRSYVGKSFLDVEINGMHSKMHPIEVRSKKIRYLDQYPAMLSDISQAASGLIFEMGAPLYQTYDFNDRPRNTYYQDFMFIEYLFRPEHLPQAFDIIKHNIYNHLESHREEVSVDQATAIGPSTLVEIISSPDSLVKPDKIPNGWPSEMSGYVPNRITHQCEKETIDTFENRLVKDLLLSIDTLLIRLKRESRVIKDAIHEMGYIDAAIKTHIFSIKELLSESWLREIGPLTYIPANSQVLQKREGYRDMFQYFLNFEFAFRMEWEDVEYHLKGYNRKLSEMYEYWCYLKLIQIISKIANQKIPFDGLFEKGQNNWSIRLKRGMNSALEYSMKIDRKPIQVKVMYNRLFSQNTKNKSYSLPFKPDYSILIHSESRDSFVHFDAKYRSDGEILEFFDNIVKDNSTSINIEDEEKRIMEAEVKEVEERDSQEQTIRTYKAGDIYKMHTYKDAILRTEGAYIFYPGDKEKIFRVDPNQDIPSVGAFPLTPGKQGKEDDELESFLRAVLKKYSE